LQQGWQQTRAGEATDFGNKDALEQSLTTTKGPVLPTTESISGAEGSTPSRETSGFFLKKVGGGSGWGGGYSWAGEKRSKSDRSKNSSALHHRYSDYDQASELQYRRVPDNDDRYVRMTKVGYRQAEFHDHHYMRLDEPRASSACDEDYRRERSSVHTYQLSIRLKK
jgi:hypothetical protein